MDDHDGVRHDPRPLGDAPTPDISALVAPALSRRLVLYLGAGVSIPWPACGPSGNEVAEHVKPIVAELLSVAEHDLPETELEALAARVERDAFERMPELKDRVAAVRGVRDMQPTYGHEVIALLVREGFAQVASANWDCGVENGALLLELTIEGVSQDIDLLRLPADALHIYKVHGCVRRPATLVLTRAEVDEPQRWARARVQDALASGTVVFVGLGTVGAYVSESVDDLMALWIDQTTTVRVVDPFGLSDPWREVLGDRADDVELAMGSDEFFDGLLRAMVARAISEVGVAARELHRKEQQDWSLAGVEGHGCLMEAMNEATADAVVRWWRDGVSLPPGAPSFIFDRGGQAALLCVAQLAAMDDTGIAVAGSEGNLVVWTGQRYFEIASRSQQHWTDVLRAGRARIDRRRRNGNYTPGMPITIVIPAATGAFPAFVAPPDIAGGDHQESDIAAGGPAVLQVVRAEDALDGRLLV